MESTQMVDVFDNFSPKTFIDTIETCVNNFSFNTEKSAQALMAMNHEKQILFLDVVESCIFALAHTDRIDGRNEISADVCRQLSPAEDPMPDVGTRFLRMHPTLQQSAMKLFCCYLDKADVPKYKDAVEVLRNEYGSRWYCFPLI